ncbi:RHS repeat-associated core domain-containing protein, partial [Fibrobacter sp.]|uniref:RHS repeat-associated core domain-containing protein n=1 Tax=Fibrobacter sp. TaxID=35828 RepID=UPI0025C293A6
DTANFVYDSEGNLVEDKSKGLKISYDWRGMPVEFRLEPTGSSSDTASLSMMYDGSGRRISKTFLTKSATAASWDTVKVTHYTGNGTEVREEFHNGTREKVNVVVNMPQGLGRYGIEDADHVAENGSAQTFEWFLKNHLGSTMLVYGTGGTSGGLKAAYDYRSFGEQVTLTSPSTGKVTENFTGKELDDETQLDYFGARYLDPMLGMWISVDPARQFSSPYLYAGNGVNPVNAADPDGEEMYQFIFYVSDMDRNIMISMVQEALRFKEKNPSADYRITIAENQADLTRIINEGKYSVVFAHGLEDFDGNVMPNRFAMNDNESFDMTYQELNNGLNSDSYAKIFTCFSNWSDDFSNVSPARNPSSLEVPFIADYNAEVHGVNGAKDAANYLDRQYQRDNGYTYEAYPE